MVAARGSCPPTRPWPARGIDLDNPAERVTAEEWLDAHRAEQLAEDAHREITEYDVDDAREEPTEVQPAAVDRRTCPTDATSEAVDRAALALSMVERRRDDSLATDAADPPDDARRDELTRWSETDAQDSQARDSGDEGLERSH